MLVRLVVHHAQWVLGMGETEDPSDDDLTADETGEVWGSEVRDAMRSLVEVVSVAATLLFADAAHNSQDGSSITGLTETRDEDCLCSDGLVWTSRNCSEGMLSEQ